LDGQFDTQVVAADLGRIRSRLAQARMLGRTDLEAASERARVAADAVPVPLIYADDDERYRLLIGAVLRTYPQFHVVGAAADGQEALALAREHKPDVVLLDVEMPLLDGLEAAQLISLELPETRIVLHTGELLDERRGLALQLGLTVVDKLAIHDTLQHLL
jgi:CheY-like chemotaxis protein